MNFEQLASLYCSGQRCSQCEHFDADRRAHESRSSDLRAVTSASLMPEPLDFRVSLLESARRKRETGSSLVPRRLKPKAAPDRNREESLLGERRRLRIVGSFLRVIAPRIAGASSRILRSCSAKSRRPPSIVRSSPLLREKGPPLTVLRGRLGFWGAPDRYCLLACERSNRSIAQCKQDDSKFPRTGNLTSAWQ